MQDKPDEPNKPDEADKPDEQDEPNKPIDRRASRRRVWGICASVVVLIAGFGAYQIRWVSSAPHASDERCGGVVDRAPDSLAGQPRKWTFNEGTVAWGRGGSVLRCGVDELPPTPDLCVSVNGVDWVLDEQRLERDGVSVLTTYGRSPAVEFVHEGAKEEAGAALTDLADAVRDLPRERRCIGLDDV
ncbi:DUF3515 family protein [Streptomyces sp. NPDC059578]|uniref:DUF3515 family protein n=1 Tax=Streptomyces sp. NPDC059578 TaxID=3346874 RepID=UPI0036C26D9F